MNELKFQLTTFLLVAILAFGGYWAFTTLDTGVTYTKDQTVVVLDDDPVDVIEPVVTVVDGEEGNQETLIEDPVTYSADLSAEETELVEKLQGLIDDGINMKEGSRGTRVGTVQNFLNIYLDTQSGVDNQYGPGTLARVKEFQDAEGLEADGFSRSCNLPKDD